MFMFSSCGVWCSSLSVLIGWVLCSLKCVLCCFGGSDLGSMNRL